MAEQSFDVMISDKEYKELKENKQRNIELLQKNKALQQKLGEAIANSKKIQKQSTKKDGEINYLVDILQNIGVRPANQELQGQANLAMLKSTAFELLGQSVINQQKGSESEKANLSKEFTAKYYQILKRTSELEGIFDSKDLQISKLNQMLKQMNETIQNRQSGDVSKTKDVQQQIKDLRQKVKDLESANLNLKSEKIKQKADHQKLLQTMESTKSQIIDKLTRDVNILRKENDTLTKRLVEFNQRIKHLEVEIVSLAKANKNNANRESQEEITKAKLKGLIDEYVRLVEKNLKGVGQLSENEVKTLLEDEMKDLVEYIPKSISHKN